MRVLIYSFDLFCVGGNCSFCNLGGGCFFLFRRHSWIYCCCNVADSFGCVSFESFPGICDVEIRGSGGDCFSLSLCILWICTHLLSVFSLGNSYMLCIYLEILYNSVVQSGFLEFSFVKIKTLEVGKIKTFELGVLCFGFLIMLYLVWI